MDAGKLDALENLVLEVDGEGPPTAEQQQQAQAAQDLDAGAREWGMIAYVVGNGLSMIAPELKQVYTEDACMGWGRSMMPVAEKYGWNGPTSVPELGLIIASMSLGVPSVLAIRERVRQMKEMKAAEEAAAKQKAAAPPAGQ
ncbi:MAG TPA: hypothetical protein VNU71_14660 [Burkholderiaceae bacterium]|nr:hypothetical protein [Burkholderiaceae bacterium]